MSLIILMMMFVGTYYAQGSRQLRGRWEPLQGYDAATYTSVKGQQPGGLYSVGQKAEAAAASASKGIRYNGGRTVISGDVYPGARAGGTTGDASVRSGNTAAEANVNLGLEAIAATGQGARAVSGSAVLNTAAPGAATSYNIASFKPQTVHNKGSVSFTDIAPTSASVSGQGNGPVAIAWGYEVGAMARSQRDPKGSGRTHRDLFD